MLVRDAAIRDEEEAEENGGKKQKKGKPRRLATRKERVSFRSPTIPPQCCFARDGGRRGKEEGRLTRGRGAYQKSILSSNRS